MLQIICISTFVHDDIRSPTIGVIFIAAGFPQSFSTIWYLNEKVMTMLNQIRSHKNSDNIP